jgi:EmrB/QacA subfamily drug resistance transporter
MTRTTVARSELPTRYRHRHLILAICCTSLLIVSMDALAINVALPSIREEFRSSTSALQWTIDAYTLVLASLLVLSGSMGDRLGRRMTFQIGLGVFTIGSLLCSLAPNVEMLILFRVLQAIGGSMLNPVAMSIITHTFDDPKERARAVGVWSAVAGIAMAAGPLMGGIMTDTVGWRGIFWLNLPLGLAGLVLTALFVPESRSSRRSRLDPFGQVLIIVMLSSVVGALIEGPHLGWLHPVTIVCGVAFVLSISIFIPYELRRRDPLIDVRFFRSMPFSSALTSVLFGFIAYSGFIFLMTIYLQEVRGYSPLAAGLHMLPMAVSQIICANISGRLVAARGPRLPLLISAGASLAVALVLALTLTPTTPEWLLYAVFLLFGVAQGFLNPPVTTLAVSGMPLSRSGSAAALTSTSRQIGTALGVALGGALTGIGASAVIGPGFAADTHRMWWTVAALAILHALLAWIAASRVGLRSRDRIAHLLEDTGSATAPLRMADAVERV